MKSSEECLCCGVPATTEVVDDEDGTVEMFCTGCSFIEAAAAREAPTWMASFMAKVIRHKRAKKALKELFDD